MFLASLLQNHQFIGLRITYFLIHSSCSLIRVLQISNLSNTAAIRCNDRHICEIFRFLSRFYDLMYMHFNALRDRNELRCCLHPVSIWFKNFKSKTLFANLSYALKIKFWMFLSSYTNTCIAELFKTVGNSTECWLSLSTEVSASRRIAYKK